MAQIFKKSFWVIIVSTLLYLLLVVIVQQFFKLEKSWLLSACAGILFPSLVIILTMLIKTDKEIIDTLRMDIGKKADKESTDSKINDLQSRFTDHMAYNEHQFTALTTSIDTMQKQVADIYNVIVLSKGKK